MVELLTSLKFREAETAKNIESQSFSFLPFARLFKSDIFFVLINNHNPRVLFRPNIFTDLNLFYNYYTGGIGIISGMSEIIIGIFPNRLVESEK